MSESWSEQYRELLATIIGRPTGNQGIPERAIAAAETRLGIRLPEPLRDYYLSVGRHRINRAMNRLWPLGKLDLVNGRLVFMEENQCVVFWGVSIRGRTADPVVSQTTDLDEAVWSAEARCSRFLSGMMCWQAVGGSLPCSRMTGPILRPLARRAIRGWRPVARVSGLSAFVQPGRVACVLDDGPNAQLRVAARDRKEFAALTSELGVPVKEI